MSNCFSLKALKNGSDPAAHFEKQLKSMGFDMNQFSTMISLINDDVMCGPQCQKERKLNELREKMDKAEKTQQDAPYKLENATKNYFTYKDGEIGYINKQRREFRKSADQDVEQMTAEFKGRADTVQQQIDRNEALKVYLKNMDDLERMYLKKNKQMKQEIEEIKATIMTNDRKSYYLAQKWSWETYVVWLCKIAYWVVTAIFVLYYVLYKGRFTDKHLVIAAALLAGLPFVLNYILTFQFRGYSITGILDQIFLVPHK